MITRRGFFGALAAVVAAIKSASCLPTQVRGPRYVTTSRDTYYYTVTYVQAFGETIALPQLQIATSPESARLSASRRG